MRKVCPWPEQQGCKQTTWELLQFSTWRKNLYLVEKGRPAASIMAWISIRVVFVDYFSNGKRRRGRRKVRKRAMPATRLRRTDGRMRGVQASRVLGGQPASRHMPCRHRIFAYAPTESMTPSHMPLHHFWREPIRFRSLVSGSASARLQCSSSSELIA